MGHRVGGDIVLALQGVRVLGDGGQGLGRSIDDLKVIYTLVTLHLLTLRAKNLESGKYSFVGNVIFFPSLTDCQGSRRQAQTET